MKTRLVKGFKIISRAPEGAFVPLPPSRGVQQSLFPLGKAQALIFVHVSEATGRELISLLESLGSSVVLELRVAPRFDVDTLDRKVVFDLFSQMNSVYCDLTVEQSSMTDHFLLLKKFAETVGRFSESHKPFVCLLERRDLTEDVVNEIMKWVADNSKQWTTYQFPSMAPGAELSFA